MKENDLLEQKLQNQEDDFRLQNEALMKELAQVFMLSSIFCIILCHHQFATCVSALCVSIHQNYCSTLCMFVAS